MDKWEYMTAPVLVHGPPGSGRSARVRQLVVRQPLTVLESSDAVTEGEAAWAARLQQSVVRHGAVVVDGQLVRGGSLLIEDIDLLERVTGESYDDWRSHREGATFHTRLAEKESSSPDPVASRESVSQ